MVIISVRWIITSDTVRSRRSSKPLNMSRSCFSTPPSRCNRSTAPRSSSCGDMIEGPSPTCMPKRRSSQLTSASIATSAGVSSRTVQAIGRATVSAKRSGALKATVFGSTSANTTIRRVITTLE